MKPRHGFMVHRFPTDKRAAPVWEPGRKSGARRRVGP